MRIGSRKRILFVPANVCSRKLSCVWQWMLPALYPSENLPTHWCPFSGEVQGPRRVCYLDVARRGFHSVSDFLSRLCRVKSVDLLRQVGGCVVVAASISPMAVLYSLLPVLGSRVVRRAFLHYSQTGPAKCLACPWSPSPCLLCYVVSRSSLSARRSGGCGPAVLAIPCVWAECSASVPLPSAGSVTAGSPVGVKHVGAAVVRGCLALRVTPWSALLRFHSARRHHLSQVGEEVKAASPVSDQHQGRPRSRIG